jgi:hypothetical protein
MHTYFKNSQDWHTKETVFNTDLYPNQDKFSQEMLDKLTTDFPDGKTPKSIDVDATLEMKILLDSAITLDLSTVELIDITAHVDGEKVSGIINYKDGGQHLQLRF